jgi:hypothetical protein
LNLDHAWEGNNEYGDSSGMMGGLSDDDVTTRLCFNPAKSWQLEWYSDKRIELDMDCSGSPHFVGKLIGVTDYEDSNAADKYVNVKIENGSTDFFIGFNLRAGINIDTREAFDKVTVHTQGDGFSRSELVATLAKGQDYVISNYTHGGLDLFIKVNDIDLGATPPFADIDIYLEGCLDSCGPAFDTCCEDSQCNNADECAIATCESDGTCSYDTSSCDGNFRMTLKTDYWPGETTWELVDDCDNGNVVMTGGPYSARNTFHYQQEDIGKSQYTLNVYDDWGDGICCENGEGLFSAKMDGLVVASGGAFQSADFVTFGSCPSNSPSQAPTSGPTSEPTLEPTSAPTPAQVELLAIVGETMYPRIPIIVTSQDLTTVSFYVEQEWSEEVISIFTQLPEDDVGTTGCYKTEKVERTRRVEYTAYCMQRVPITVVDLWVADVGFLANDTAEVPECCYPTTSGASYPTVQYTFKIHCVAK